MWRRKRLVQIQVHHIDAEISGAHFADQGVHICPVHVEQTALCVHDVGNLVNLLLKNPQGIGIGEHERGYVLVHLRRQSAQHPPFREHSI